MIRMSCFSILVPWASAHAIRSSWVKVSALVEVLLATEAGHVEQDAASHNTALRDGGHAGLVQSADRAARVVPIPELAAVPDVAEGVVLRRALEERVDLVVCIVQAARELGSVVAVP